MRTIKWVREVQIKFVIFRTSCTWTTSAEVVLFPFEETQNRVLEFNDDVADPGGQGEKRGVGGWRCDRYTAVDYQVISGD